MSIEKGNSGDVNAKDTYGETALIRAAKAGDLRRVKALIAAGANLNVTNSNGQTAITLAAGAGMTDCVKALIAADANLNVKTTSFETSALIEAVRNSKKECVQALIIAGADMNLKGTKGWTALEWARANYEKVKDQKANKYHTEVVAILQTLEELDKKNNNCSKEIRSVQMTETNGRILDDHKDNNVVASSAEIRDILKYAESQLSLTNPSYPLTNPLYQKARQAGACRRVQRSSQLSLTYPSYQKAPSEYPYSFYFLEELVLSTDRWPVHPIYKDHMSKKEEDMFREEKAMYDKEIYNIRKKIDNMNEKQLAVRFLQGLRELTISNPPNYSRNIGHFECMTILNVVLSEASSAEIFSFVISQLKGKSLRHVRIMDQAFNGIASEGFEFKGRFARILVPFLTKEGEVQGEIRNQHYISDLNIFRISNDRFICIRRDCTMYTEADW